MKDLVQEITKIIKLILYYSLVSDKANNFTLIKNGLKHPLSVHYFLREYRRLRMNRKHPYVKSENVRSFEKYEDFLKYLIDIEYKENYLLDLTDLYYNLVKRIESIYGKDKSLSILSLEEAVSVYFLVQNLKPEVVIETGVSDGMSSFFILTALNENKKGSLYSIDLRGVGMPMLYGKEPGWIVMMYFVKDGRLFMERANYSYHHC